MWAGLAVSSKGRFKPERTTSCGNKCHCGTNIFVVVLKDKEEGAHYAEAPAEFTGKISVHFVFLSSWHTKLGSVRTDSGHYCFITENLTGLAGRQHSQSELASNSEQVFPFF